MKHTPGEWFSGATGSVLSGTFEVHLGMDKKDSNGEYKRVCTGKTNDFYEAQANANLIASAPEMLETLYLCRMVLANAKMNDKDLDIHKAWEIVFNTIEKAEAK